MRHRSEKTNTRRTTFTAKSSSKPTLSRVALALVLLMARHRKTPLMVCDAQKKLKAEGVAASKTAVRDAFVELWRHGLVAKLTEFN
jgi:hypothetical protein